MRDYLYGPDIAAALAAVLECPVNVGSGEAVALREIVDRLAEEVGRPELVRFGASRPAPTSRRWWSAMWPACAMRWAGLRPTACRRACG
ncbi:MAG: hypothetical protein M3350_06725 [Actinomycetota bacterium]|nr:hypothetical protein [Actinomycetota bacterium]MDQ3720455.1 hypothetical protein [Actinomycetota bacterium]